MIVCMWGYGVGGLGLLKAGSCVLKGYKTESFLLAIHWNSAETNGNLKIRIPRGENVQLLGILQENLTNKGSHYFSRPNEL